MLENTTGIRPIVWHFATHLTAGVMDKLAAEYDKLGEPFQTIIPLAGTGEYLARGNGGIAASRDVRRADLMRDPSYSIACFPAVRDFLDELKVEIDRSFEKDHGITVEQAFDNGQEEVYYTYEDEYIAGDEMYFTLNAAVVQDWDGVHFRAWISTGDSIADGVIGSTVVEQVWSLSDITDKRVIWSEALTDLMPLIIGTWEGKL